MTRVVDWKVHARCKSWVILQRLIAKTELGSIPWVSKQSVPSKLHTHSLTGATLQVFDKACKAHALSATDCPITPIRGNPDFPPGLPKSYLSKEWPYTQMQAKHLFCRGKFLRLQDLVALSNTKSFPSWLKHFLDVPVKIAKFTSPPTVFESLCSSSSPQSHVISALYVFMFGEPYSSLCSDHTFWESALDREIGEASWDQIHLYIHKGFLNVNTQENGYKLKTRCFIRFSRWCQTTVGDVKQR